MTLKEKIGKGLLVLSCIQMLSGVSGAIYYGTSGPDRPECANELSSLERTLNHARIKPIELLENPEAVLRRYEDMQVEYETLKSDPEVQTEIQKYEKERDRTMEGFGYSLGGGVMGSIILSQVGLGCLIVSRRRKREEEEKENDESGFIEPSL